MSDRLDRIARRAEREPFFLAGLLANYARSEGLDDDGLAAALGCARGVLTRLRLCRAPRDDPRGLAEDVACISGHLGVSAELLLAVVRRGQVLRRLAGAGGGVRGLFVAARDGDGPKGGEGA